MNPGEFVDSVERFISLSPTEQVKRFCWYMSFHREKEPFGAGDIIGCFEDAKLQKPSNTRAFLLSLAQRNPPYILRKGNGYGLSRSAHDEFDESLGERASTIAVGKALAELPSRLTIEVEKAFLEEAIKCLKVKAYRAAIVMTWNLAFDHLCNVIIATKLPEFNAELKKAFPKASTIVKREDFEDLKESHVIQVARSADVITSNVRKVFDEKLTRRNMAAHPASSIVIKQETAEDVIRDLIENGVLGLPMP